jgi:phage terminase large subunit-like protein
VIDDLKREPWISNPDESVIEVPQTFLGMSSACLRVQAEILSSTIDAGGCPVTGWAVSNAAGQTDGKDNLMFVKKKSRGRIDPVISHDDGDGALAPTCDRRAAEIRNLVFGGR